MRERIQQIWIPEDWVPKVSTRPSRFPRRTPRIVKGISAEAVVVRMSNFEMTKLDSAEIGVLTGLYFDHKSVRELARQTKRTQNGIKRLQASGLTKLGLIREEPTHARTQR